MVSATGRTILFGVTAGQTLPLLGTIPAELNRRGWDVHVVSARASSFTHLFPPGVTLHDVPMKRAPSFSDISAFGIWRRLLQQVNPDVVSIGTPKAALLGLVAAWQQGVPIRVYHLRGLRLEGAKGLARALLWVAEKITASSSSHISSVSSSLAARYSSLRLAKAEKLTVLRLGSSRGVNTKIFSPLAESGVQDGPAPAPRQTMLPVVGFVGRLNVDKGIGALAVIRHQLFEASIRHEMVVIGPDDGAPPDLFTSHQHFYPPTLFMGRVDDVAGLYAQMDVVVLPTLREGFPNVVLEAASCGIPVVTTDATGAVDSVVNGVTGLVVSARDSSAIASAVGLLLRDQEFARELGQNAREWVLKWFDESSVANSHVDFYEGFLPGHIS